MTRSVRVHSRGLLARAIERLRGRNQLLIGAGDDLPLVVASYPRGRAWFATSLESALTFTFRHVSTALRESYRETLERVPSLVVVMLHARNPCTCLGHHHPPGTESRLAKRLASDTGRRVGEIDLAVEAIRLWEPMPLSLMALSAGVEWRRHGAWAELEYQRVQAALLSVFLHELEHLAFPRRAERTVRERSNRFYRRAVEELIAQEFGEQFGISAQPGESAAVIEPRVRHRPGE